LDLFGRKSLCVHKNEEFKIRVNDPANLALAYLDVFFED
jgi:hypothetical protein